MIFRTFISTYMNIRRRKNIHYLIYHIFGKLQRFLISSTQYIPKYPESSSHLIRSSCTSQFRIRSQRGQHVTRHIDFRNHCNISFSCISHNLSRLILRIIPTDRDTIHFFRFPILDGTFSFRAYFCKFRIFFYLNTPTLIFSKMPVKIIDIMQGKHINNLFK